MVRENTQQKFENFHNIRWQHKCKDIYLIMVVEISTESLSITIYIIVIIVDAFILLEWLDLFQEWQIGNYDGLTSADAAHVYNKFRGLLFDKKIKT